MKKIASLIVLCLSALTMLQASPLWMRYNTISPQGDRIAFSYKGDIYVVNAQGGTAQQLTTNSAYDFNPVWSNDGKTIAFASDRNGNFDVYTVPAQGGVAKRVTYNSAAETPMAFSADDKAIYFTAYIQKDFAYVQFPSGWMTELYTVPVEGGRPVQVTPATVCSMSLAADGKSFLYTNRTGSENIWRKHQVSSVARDIFYYDAKKGTHRQITTNVGEDRDARFIAGTKDMVFLSERNGGTFNVYRASVDNAEKAVAITNFKNHPVRFLSVANNGTVCYNYMGEIYTQMPNGQPKKVNIELVNDQDNTPQRGSFGRASQLRITPDGKQIAFVVRGEIFVTTDEYATTKQITHTAEAELQPTFSPDGKKLVYTSERDGFFALYMATMERSEEKNFAYATLVKEEPLFKDHIERTNAEFSPDGKEIAFIEQRRYLKVMNLATKAVRQITDGTQHYGTDEWTMDYQWSPDGKWFAITLISNRREPYSDVGIISADGKDHKIHNITNDGYITTNPQWVLDGNAIIFQSNRLGMRSHASWGSQEDVFIAFMNQDAYDKFHLSKEEYQRVKEEEEAMKKAAKANESNDKKKDDKKGKDEKKEETKESKGVEVDTERLEERVSRLTPMSSNLSGIALSNDGEKLYFLSAFEKGYDLWELNTREGGTKILKKLGSNGGSNILMTKKGDAMFLTANGSIQKIDTKGSATPIQYDATMELDRAAEREYMFNHVFLQENKRLFRRDHNGADMDLIRRDYEPFLEHINNNYDFSELLSEILGELNVSHSGSGYTGTSVANGDVTAQLGVLLDMSYTGKGIKITEVLKDGPFDNKHSKVKAGDVIEKIDGVEIEADKDYYALLNKKVGKMVLVSISRGGQKWDEIIKPISKSAQNELLYQRWVKHNAEMVEKLSGGKLGYVHIRSMADASYRDVYADILGKYNMKEGIVIDTRFNGGGRLHEDIETLFSGEKYLEQVIRDTVSCVMPSRRYNKPSIMLVCEANYSNAHGTPWVYNYKKMGKIVGMPVPGTMSSVTWETLQDPTLYFGLPVIGYRTEQGNYLENTQLEPDIKVRNTPEKMAEGVDEQLEAAVKALLEDLKNFHTWGEK